jgi:chromosome segregation ATPase
VLLEEIHIRQQASHLQEILAKQAAQIDGTEDDTPIDTRFDYAAGVLCAVEDVLDTRRDLKAIRKLSKKLSASKAKLQRHQDANAQVQEDRQEELEVEVELQAKVNIIKNKIAELTPEKQAWRVQYDANIHEFQTETNTLQQNFNASPYFLTRFFCYEKDTEHDKTPNVVHRTQKGQEYTKRESVVYWYSI